MTTTGRVQRRRHADAARRRVRTTGVGRIGKRTTVPRQKRPSAKRPRYRKSVAVAGFSAMLGALFVATGQIFWAVGAVTSAGAGVAVAHLEYRRQLAEVKRTGKPIGVADVSAKTLRTGDLEDRPEPKPVDLDPPASRQPRTRPTTERPPQRKASDHLARCQAKPPGGPTCRCKDGPNRKKTGTRKPTARKRTK